VNMQQWKEQARNQPITDTSPAHVKLAIALGLVIAASQELEEEMTDHECEHREAKFGRGCPWCDLEYHATHLPYVVEGPCFHMLGESGSSCRIEALTEKTSELLDQWIAAEGSQTAADADVPIVPSDN
jgi:hypothetical protein